MYAVGRGGTILRIDRDDRKIGLSRRLEASDEEIAEASGGGTSAAPREELKGGMGEGSGPLFSMGAVKQAGQEPDTAPRDEAGPEAGEETEESEP